MPNSSDFRVTESLTSMGFLALSLSKRNAAWFLKARYNIEWIEELIDVIGESSG